MVLAATGRHRPRLIRGFTLVEVLVTLAIVTGLVVWSTQRFDAPRKQSADQAAIVMARQLADNFADYAALRGGVFPWVNGGTWTWGGAIAQLGSAAEFSSTCPAIFLNTDRSCYLMWTGDGNTNGTTFFIVFAATGGTGQWYCLDPAGLATVAYDASAPWIGCK